MAQADFSRSLICPRVANSQGAGNSGGSPVSKDVEPAQIVDVRPDTVKDLVLAHVVQGQPHWVWMIGLCLSMMLREITNHGVSHGPACDAFSTSYTAKHRNLCPAAEPIAGPCHGGPRRLAALPRKMTRSSPWRVCPPWGWVGATSARWIGSSPQCRTLHQSPRAC